jgi:hypothetical protein
MHTLILSLNANECSTIITDHTMVHDNAFRNITWQPEFRAGIQNPQLESVISTSKKYNSTYDNSLVLHSVHLSHLPK